MHRVQPPRPLSILAALLAATICLQPVVAFAQCDADTEARLEFLETRLDEGEKSAKLWWRSWMAVFTIGAVYGIVGGATDDNNETAIASYITAGKSTLGIAQLVFRPYVARHGAEPIREIPKSSAEGCSQRLQLAEKHMASSAKDANMRRSWVRHVSALVLNLGAGIVVAEALDEPEQGWQDFAISEVSSELHIWTYPTRARNDWEEYRTRYFGTSPALSSTAPQWDFVARRGGVGIVYKF